jgi:hypothetical protein
VSAPNVVPFVVTNRTGKRNRAGRLPVIRPFLAACYVMGLRSFVKTASRSGLLVCRNGVRTFAAALRGQTSLACFVGALAAAPGSVAMPAHRPVTSSCHTLSLTVTLRGRALLFL